MSVTYNLLIVSDLPPEYDKMIRKFESNHSIAKQKYEALIDFINLNQGSQFDQINFSPKYYEEIANRFRINSNFNKPHLLTKFSNNIVIQVNDFEGPVKINILDHNSYNLILLKINNILQQFDTKTYGNVLGWKIENSEGKVYDSFDQLTASFKEITVI